MTSLKKLILIVAISVIVASIITIPLATEEFANAGSLKKIHFTQTITSSQDPGQGHESHQLALILSPNSGTIYDGSLTYTASEPVQVVVLHEIPKSQSQGQPIWTVDGETVYGLSLINTNTNAGSIEFTGAALALHTADTKQFSATVSVDGWIRGQPTEVIMQKIETEQKQVEPTILLSRTNVPAKIPMHMGTFDGKPVYYIITDTNNKSHAELITKQQGWKVELAPPLNNTPKTALQTVYMFTDGVKGDGVHGFQEEVFSSTPSQTDKYSALGSITKVSWKTGQVPKILNSTQAIMDAEKAGRINLNQTKIVINMPQIIWPDGQMIVKNDKTINDSTPYGGGQITEINKDEMTVTFIAHRGWGPDGQTIYYIVTDATPSAPAEMMGVTNSPSSANLIANSAAVDLYQFSNGIKGSGPLGFQAGIAVSVPGDETYSPMWRIFMIEWKDPKNAKILETKADIDSFKSEDLITVNLARPMNSDHIVNCPFIDPFQ